MAEQAVQRMVVSADPEACFAVVADVERYPEWVADVKAVQVESRDEEGRPAVVAFRAAAFGRSTSYRLRYDSWSQLDGDLTSRMDGSYTFRPLPEGGTEVTYSLEVALRVPLPGFIKRRAQSRIVHAALAELKSRVESQITA
ncbi:SRPBCC family protein [Aciditerrimonas ferrireducens]|uniref:SRPBCC family protein n=1 Tax=Aciditerrimonas ferrireducens TaxID=667306 RepID=UPI0020056B1D|nr:SRPBCC family protein [Aciditerrimonas ferrireducens]MCK4177330.1 SRPBCC family protein [Aciditerrimonas ferrireducens]